MLKITTTCEETYSVLCVASASARHENVVREYCESHDEEDAIETVFTTDADECKPEIVRAAVEFLRDRTGTSNAEHDDAEKIAELESLLA